MASVSYVSSVHLAMVAGKEARTMRTYNKVSDYFHNYEHDPKGLTHCHSDGKHPYRIKHYKRKHVISNRTATGHGRGNKPQKFKFAKKLGNGWDLSSGMKID